MLLIISEKKFLAAGSSRSSKTLQKKNFILIYYILFSNKKTTKINDVFTLCLSIAQGRLTHVTQAYYTFAATVHEEIALFWMKLSRCDHFG